MEFFYSIDVALLRFFNDAIANPVFDAAMPYLTNIHNFYSGYAVALGALFIFGGRTGRITVGLLMLTILISDQLSSNFLKGLVERSRPCYALEGVRLITGTTGGFSFPSSHAVNHFAAATVASLFYPKARWYLFSFALVVSFSRLYLGLHYPSDTAGGALIGMLIGYLVVTAYRLTMQRITTRTRQATHE